MFNRFCFGAHDKGYITAFAGDQISKIVKQELEIMMQQKARLFLSSPIPRTLTLLTFVMTPMCLVSFYKRNYKVI